MSAGELSLQKWWLFRERRCNFSLGFRVFGQSDRFGPSRKVVLRMEDYTWASVSGVFDKLHEVGFHPTCFTLGLNVLLMLELIEVVSGHLIGPKSWNQNVGIYETHVDSL